MNIREGTEVLKKWKLVVRGIPDTIAEVIILAETHAKTLYLRDFQNAENLNGIRQRLSASVLNFRCIQRSCCLQTAVSKMGSGDKS
jgi:hypothetical protein